MPADNVSSVFPFEPLVITLPTPTFSMYTTKGVEAVATITELRSYTSELVEQAKRIKSGVLIQKNNEPYVVLLPYDLYTDLLAARSELSRQQAKSR